MGGREKVVDQLGGAQPVVVMVVTVLAMLTAVFRGLCEQLDTFLYCERELRGLESARDANNTY